MDTTAVENKTDFLNQTYKDIITNRDHIAAEIEAERALQKLTPVEDQGARFTADDPLRIGGGSSSSGESPSGDSPRLKPA